MRYVRNNDQQHRDIARKLRRQMTVGERALWSRLRQKTLGFRVRRQFPVGQFVLDFYVVEARLCIELDGPLHESLPDRIRDEVLEGYGIQTLRIPLKELQAKEEFWVREIQMLVDLRKRTKPWCRDDVDDEISEDDEPPP